MSNSIEYRFKSYHQQFAAMMEWHTWAIQNRFFVSSNLTCGTNKNNLQNNKKYVIIFIQDKKGAKKWFGLIEAADVNIGGV